MQYQEELGPMEGDVSGEDYGQAVPLVGDLFGLLEGEEVELVEGEEDGDVDGESLPLVGDILGLLDGGELGIVKGEDDGGAVLLVGDSLGTNKLIWHR